MRTILSKKIKASVVALALQFTAVASVHAGGATLLHLPIAGVTAENRDRCAELFAEKFRPVLIDWKNGDVKMTKEGSSDVVVLRPDRGQISLSDVESALEGSPFTIERERLEYFGLLRICIKETADYEKHTDALATLDGKKLQTHVVETADGEVWITLRDTTRNTMLPPAEKRKRSIITHARLTEYLSENELSLVAILWGRHPLDYSEPFRETNGKSYAEAWRGEAYGARPAATAGEKNVSQR